MSNGVKGPVPAEITVAQGLMNVGPGSNPPAYAPNPSAPVNRSPDVTKGNVAGVWGYVGLLLDEPSQTSSPPITCAVYGQGGVVGVNGFSGAIEVADAGGDGVIGFGGANGVHGIGANGTGVAGTSTGGTGVKGISTSGVGVAGEGQSSGAGVYGANTSSLNGGPGVFGSSITFDGVHGESQSSQHAGVSGINTGKTVGIGVYGSGSPAGFFQGDVTVTGILKAESDVAVAGTLTATVDVVLGSDCAEDFDIAPSADVDPGTVMVLTDNGALQPSQTAYDRKVAGVISGAGDYRAGLILGRCESSQERAPLALMGKVYCKVDADPAPIAVGDLLTTSARPGFGMKATDSAQAFGAVIGKALKPLRAGQGMIPILIALQ